MFKENFNQESKLKNSYSESGLAKFLKDNTGANEDKIKDFLDRSCQNEFDKKNEVWKLLIEEDISPQDKPSGEKTPYSYYDLDRLIVLLETIKIRKELEKKEAA